MNKRLFFDLETLPDIDRLSPDWGPVDEWDEKKIKEGSVNPLYCRIISLAYAINDGPVTIMLTEDYDAEARALSVFWGYVGQGYIPTGYNILGFDIPVILARSMILGVPATKFLRLQPWYADTVDLLKKIWPYGKAQPLKQVCNLVGVEVPADGVDGGQVFEMWRSGNIKGLVDYADSDVVVLQRLYKKMMGVYFS